ncbi:MAG: hypothetical protein ABUS79_11415 [Pseudomonadota bacterium]
MAAIGVAVTACGPSLATLQPAHVAPKGHLQVAAGVEVGVPTGTISRVLDSGVTLSKAAGDRALTDAEVAQLFDAGVILTTSPPSAGYVFALAYTIVDRTEVQARYAGGGWRLGGRYQVLRHEDGPFDFVVGLGVARSTASIPFTDEVPALHVDDFSRWSYDLPLQIGTSRDWFRVWIGPRIMYSRFGTRVTVTLPNNPVEEARLDGNALYLGGQGGVAFGYRYAFVGFELTMAGMMGSATASATSTSMLSVPGRSTDISGLVVYPAFSLMGEF